MCPYLPFKGSELRATILKGVYSGAVPGFKTFRIRGLYWGTIGSTLHHCRLMGVSNYLEGQFRSLKRTCRFPVG